MIYSTDPKTGTVWPLDVAPPGDDDWSSLEWKLRYGRCNRHDLLLAAGIVHAYMHLAAGANARESLARLRRAARAAQEPTEGDQP